MSIDSIINTIKERANHPFFGIFSFFVIVFNIESIIVISLGDDSVYSRLNYVKLNLTGINTLITYPLTSTLIYVIASQWIMYCIDVINTQPLKLRYELQVMKEQSESQARKELMKIKESEIVAEAELDVVKRDTHKSDLEIYTLSKNRLEPYQMSKLREEIDNDYVHKDLYSKLKSYVSFHDLGEIHFKDTMANLLHVEFVKELRELVLQIEDKTDTNSNTGNFKIYNNAGFKEQLVNSLNSTFNKYNKFNVYIKNEML